MLPKRYVLPVRIVVLASLLISSLFILTHLHDLSPLLIMGLIFHLFISFRALTECKKSIEYHRLMEEYQRKIDSLD
ncbi:MAG: hypothetical protein OEL55_05745 [Desulfobulbaceae bacterium]|nr:hypothetical protein [Desulfobulbaceae bacterium]